MAECADACHSPSFLKKITEMPMRTLNLPSTFVRTHGNLLSSNMILEGPSRKHWKVGVDGSSESVSASFGQGFQNFVADHDLQLGDQLCFFLPAHSHFQVQIYDESGCQKTSAQDATGSHATLHLAPETLKRTPRSSSLFSRRPSELQIPLIVADSAPQTPTSTKPILRLSEIRRLDDPTEAAEHLLRYARENAEKELSNLQLSKDSVLRDSLTVLTNERSTSVLFNHGDSSIPIRNYTNDRNTSLLFSNPYSTRWSADNVRVNSHESLPGFDSDLSDCFIDIEKARAAPDLEDTQPLSPEDLRPCWE